MSNQAELILSGGRIWKGLGLGFAEALAIGGGRILAIGSDEEIAALAGPASRRVDLRGRLAVPGLMDAHMHPIHYGTGMGHVDLRPETVPTLGALLAALKARADTLPAGAWVIGRGYSSDRLDVKRHPLRDELDAIAPRNPVYVARSDGRLAVANSLALELAGISEETPEPVGGRIERAGGRMTGLVIETAREPILAVIPPPTVEAFVEGIECAGRHLLSQGITSVMEAGIGFRNGWIEMEAYLKAHGSGRLPVRTYAAVMGDRTLSIFEQAVEQGFITGHGDDMFRIGPLKLLADGSAGGRTAAMSRPYEGGGEDDTGILSYPDRADLEARVLAGHRAGYQIATHAIGDAAIDQVIDAYALVLAEMPDPDRRHRIEHCGFARPDQVQRMKALGIIPVPQPSFPYYFGESYVRHLGLERVAASYPMRDWMDAGLHPSASTDCSVTDVAPMPVIFNMVTRRTREGAVLGEDQRLSMEEALHAYTWCGAYSAHAEAVRGQLLPGMLADVAVFDRNLFTIGVDEIIGTRCDLTILAGEIVHNRAA